jgi:hypothetical protein
MTEITDEIRAIYAEADRQYQKIRPELAKLSRDLGREVDLGYSILGPLIKNPPLMIVGLNPAGREWSVPEGEPPWPSEHELATAEYTLARNLQTTFGSSNMLQCTSVNVVFLRSEGWEEYQPLRKIAAEMERFSVEAAKRIIRLLEPERLLILGIDAPELLLGKKEWWKRDGGEWKPTLSSKENKGYWLLHPIAVEGTEGWVTRHPSWVKSEAHLEAIGAEVCEQVKFQPPG